MVRWWEGYLASEGGSGRGRENLGWDALSVRSKGLDVMVAAI